MPWTAEEAGSVNKRCTVSYGQTMRASSFTSCPIYRAHQSVIHGCSLSSTAGASPSHFMPRAVSLAWTTRVEKLKTRIPAAVWRSGNGSRRAPVTPKTNSLHALKGPALLHCPVAKMPTQGDAMHASWASVQVGTGTRPAPADVTSSRQASTCPCAVSESWKEPVCEGC